LGARDPHRFINELDSDAVERIIARLESRAKDKVFTRLFEKYVAQLVFPQSARVLEIGCGTGTNLRFLARRGDISGEAFGVDHCQLFIEAAERFTQEENVADKIEFRVGDVHSLLFPADTFDVVIAHTLISHVTEPATVIREMARVVRPGGTVVIFDGDYASLTYAHPDHEFGHQMDTALANASFNNPRIMRDLPRLLPELGLKLTSAWGDAVTEIGQGSYFKSFAETYAPYVTRAGLMPAQKVEAWLTAQQQSIENGTFFASCTYYTYLAQAT
jgi:ubiquinone/menaquinone biosynthesis C-methylase UbiE